MLTILIIFGAKYLIVFIALAAVWFFFTQKKEIQKQILMFSVFLLPVAYIAAKIASYFYFDARPFVVGNFTPLIAHASDNGFPSDHTLLSSALAAIVFAFDRKMGAMLFLLAILVGASRVLAGVHHGIDILGSLLIVGCVAFIGEKIILKRS